MTPQEFDSLRTKALESNDPKEMVNVAWAYRDGDGTDPDVTRYFEWIKKAADAGSKEAMYHLAVAYKEGEGTNLDDTRYFEFMKKAAEGGDREAMFNLASAYIDGVGTSQDSSQYFYWTTKMANDGASGAMHSLAIAYREGIGTAPDAEQFFSWAKNAVGAAENANKHGEEDRASEDLPKAILTLAQAYKDGIGTRRNRPLYLKWLKRAAEEGERVVTRDQDVPSELATDLGAVLFHLAEAYKSGNGTTPDPKESVKWMKKAAKRGHAEAMIGLANAYKDGLGTRRNGPKYLEWMRKAAESGHVEGMFRVALAYGTAEGVENSPVEFLKWIRKAVERAHPDAFIVLGLAELQQIGFIDKLSLSSLREKLNSLMETVLEILDKHKVTKEVASDGVSHFTTLGALHSMLPENPNKAQERNFLRLYNISYVNDPLEGKTLLNSDFENSECLLQFFVKSEETGSHDPIPWKGQKFSVYVGSFTLNRDRLDLWRAYGRDGEGYCIVTPIKAFQQDVGEQRHTFMETALSGDFAKKGTAAHVGSLPRLYRVRYRRREAEETLKKLKPCLDDIQDEKRTFRSMIVMMERSAPSSAKISVMARSPSA